MQNRPSEIHKAVFIFLKLRNTPTPADRGFTLIEMMVVVAIIAILALITMPNNYNRTVQLQVVESIELIEMYKGYIERTYMLTGSFPEDNEAAGAPDANQIKGNFLAELHIENGVINLEFGQKMHDQHHGKILSVRPVYVESDSLTPISWICGSDEIPDGMLAAGNDSTTLESEFLPIRCR